MLISLMGGCFALVLACRRPPNSPEKEPTTLNKTDNTPENHGRSAESLFLKADYENAAQFAQRELITNPDDADLILLAAKIEAARGNPKLAIEISNDLVGNPANAKEVAVLRYSQSLLSNDAETAQESLEYLRRIEPQDYRWLHDLWILMNRRGMRHEASELADALCHAGLATDEHMLSLVRRTDAFPPNLESDERLKDFFFPGLGLARWYFTQQQYPQAIEELQNQQILTPDFSGQSEAPAALALYGRLLAESQLHEEMPSWHAQCDETVQAFGDYWAALGLFLIDQGKNDAAARALLEAVYRNPTDRVCFQRLGRVLDALDRAEDAVSFRAAGILISETESLADSLRKRQVDRERRSTMAEKLMQLYRPFESLQWAQSRIPQNDTRSLNLIRLQRQKLQSNALASTMAFQAALMELDRNAFSFGDSIEVAFGQLALKKPHETSSQVLVTPRLVNVASQVGLDFEWFADTEKDLKSIAIYQSIGGGIAVIDYDLDGWPDVYFAQGSGKPPTGRSTRSNQLFRNLAGTFSERTDEASANDWNFSSGLAIGDVNQDGFADIYIGNLGTNRLLINQGDGTFQDTTSSMGPAPDTFTTSLAIADLDGDSLPDLFECNYIEMVGAFARPKIGSDGMEVQTSPLEHFAQPDRWFRNRGDATFVMNEIDDAVASPGTSLGVLVVDFDGDHTNEVFVGNDERPNHFLKSGEDGRLRNVADLFGCAYGFAGAATGCMGIAAGDFNHDGKLDMHVTNFLDEPANLYLQNSHAGFQDAANRYHIDTASRPYVGFGTKAIDLDRDRWLDLAVTNGHIFDMRRFNLPYTMPPQLLMSRGDQFELVTVEDPSGYWQGKYLGRTMNTIDYDRDGAVDLIIGNLDAPTALLHNETPSTGHWVQFEVVGVQSERDAIGTKITVVTDQGELSQWVTAGDGYLSSDESFVDFGLGDINSIRAVFAEWPDGTMQTFKNVEFDRRYLMTGNNSQLHDRQP